MSMIDKQRIAAVRKLEELVIRLIVDWEKASTDDERRDD